MENKLEKDVAEIIKIREENTALRREVLMVQREYLHLRNELTALQLEKINELEKTLSPP